MKRLAALALSAALLLTGCSGPAASGDGASQAPASQSPASQAPTSQVPTSQVPASQDPASSNAPDRPQAAQTQPPASRPTVSQGPAVPPSPAPGAESDPLARLALRRARYPQFPQRPVMDPESMHTAADWDEYDRAYSAYHEALYRFRGEELDGAALTALADFARKSTLAALASRQGKNTVCSPASLWAALALAARCAGGESRSQVLSALGVPDAGALETQAARLWRRLYTDDGLSSLIPANSVWLNSSMDGAYVQETLDALAEDYYADSYSVPMGTALADQAVTDWAAEQTRGLIGSGGPVVQTKPETLALLASSLYYRAAWLDAFSADATAPDIFTAADGTRKQADFMHGARNQSYILGENWRSASLPLDLGEMIFVLPDEGTAPEELLGQPGFLSALLGQGEPAGARHTGTVRWSVPRFDVNSDLDLNGTLAALGVTDLLDPQKADLSPLTDLPACLSGARQLARVKVDEIGVEAAAVTLMAIDTAAPVEDPEPFVMDLDRPFLFVIQTEGIPLFVGVVNTVEG